MPFKQRLRPGRRPDQTREVYRNTPNKAYVIKYIIAKNDAGIERIKEVYAAGISSSAYGHAWVKIRTNATYEHIAKAIKKWKDWNYKPRSRRKVPKI
jgi:hypothetical protein